MNTITIAPASSTASNVPAQVIELPLDVLALVGGGEGTITPY
jgi:hypothetical protein